MSNAAAALAPLPEVSEDDYQAFYAVIAATARGRAFLDEHARRQRHAETEVLLAALKRLENQVAAHAAATPLPNQPVLAEVGAVLETVRGARAEIDAVRLGAALAQLIAALDSVQSRLSALLPAAPAPNTAEPRPIEAPFSLAITAVAAQALAAAEPEDEPVKVIKAGSIPAPPPFTGDDFSFADTEVSEQEDLQAAYPAVSAADPEEDPFAPIMSLSEEERLALFS